MDHTPQLLPDSTLWAQLVIFVLTYLVLNSLIFKPFLAVLKARKERTLGLMEQAAQLEAEAAELELKYESQLLEGKKAIAAWTEAEKKRLSNEEKEIIQSARESASQELEAKRKVLNAEIAVARADLMEKVQEYSSIIAGKILGRKVEVTATNYRNKKGLSEAPSSV